MVQDINRTLHVFRTTVLGITMFFALLQLSLGAAITHWTSLFLKGLTPDYFPYAALTIATAILTLATVPIMFSFSVSRKGAFINMNIVEVVWLGVLWVLWLATGALAADGLSLVSDCGDFILIATQRMCRETQAVSAFGFLSWILLMTYDIFFLVLVIRQQMRGTPGVWTSYVAETDFSAQAESQPAYPVTQMANANPGYVPQPQYPPVQQQPEQQYQQQYQQQQQVQAPIMNPPQSNMAAYPQV